MHACVILYRERLMFMLKIAEGQREETGVGEMLTRDDGR